MPTLNLPRHRLFPLSRPLTLACAAALAAAVSVAQTAPASTAATDEETIVLDAFVVSSVRSSLMEAQEVKRNSLVLIDSIAAQDIGKLPDNTVADALQRVPGIQVGRANGEVSLVLIRGLPNIGTTLNGHEIFTGTGRGVALQDLPAELVSRLDVHKSVAPEHIEGGIAGLIDIRLRRPFDLDGRQIAFGGRATYSDHADKMSYVGSALVSDRWATPGGGEVGALYATSYRRHNYMDQTVFNFLFEPQSTTLVPGQDTVMLPLTQGSLIVPGDRRRTAHNVSLQFRPNEELEVYTDFLYTKYEEERQVHFLIGFPRFGELQSVDVVPGTNVPTRTVSTNNFHLTSTQAFNNWTDSYQGVVGLNWRRGNIRASTEVVYNWSSVKDNVLIVDTQFVPPAPGTFTFNYNIGGRADLAISQADPAAAENYRLWGLFDNRGYQTSDQVSWRGDVEYLMGDGFLTGVKVGLRATDRDAAARASSVNDVPPADGRGTRVTSTIPGFTSINPPGAIDSYGTPHWIGADPGFLYGRPDEVRALFGRPAGRPDFNPTNAFNDTEKTLGGYIQATYHADLGNLPLDGLFGVRIVQSDQSLTGYRSDGSRLDSDHDQTDVMPMLNGRLGLRENLYLRFAAGRTVTRPNFADLNPVATLNAPTTTGGAAGTGSGGNPDLENVESNNLDVSIEHYFGRGNYVSLTGFYREIEGYVQSFAQLETVGGIDYIVVRPRNSGKGKLQGIEATYQHFPEFLPAALRGFGVQTNYTYIEGDTDTADTRPGAAPGARVRQDYAQVSRHNYNVVLIYERGAFSSRLAYNWRGRFTDTFDGPNAPGSPLRQIIAKPREQLDFSASYALNDHMTITFDVTNITNSKYQDYFFDPNLYPRDTRAYDRTYALGARFRF